MSAFPRDQFIVPGGRLGCRMRATLRVVPPEAFEAWLATQSPSRP